MYARLFWWLHPLTSESIQALVNGVIVIMASFMFLVFSMFACRLAVILDRDL